MKKLILFFLTLSLVSTRPSSAKLPFFLDDSYTVIKSMYILGHYITPIGILLGNSFLKEEVSLEKNYCRGRVGEFIKEQIERNGLSTDQIKIRYFGRGFVGIWDNVIILSEFAFDQLTDALETIDKQSLSTKAEKDAAQKIVLAYEVIIAHEIGHFKHHDTRKDTLRSWLYGFSATSLVSRYAMTRIAEKNGWLQPPTTIKGLFKNLLVLEGLAYVGNIARDLIPHWFSRKCESKADAYAFEQQKNPEALITPIRFKMPEVRHF